MWEHNAVVNDIASTERNPNFGGVPTEMPNVVTCSDDRTVRVWNPVQHHCDAVIRPFNHHCATIRVESQPIQDTFNVSVPERIFRGSRSPVVEASGSEDGRSKHRGKGVRFDGRREF